jgi:hypothetical protein
MLLVIGGAAPIAAAMFGVAVAAAAILARTFRPAHVTHFAA